jgi:hypothetical protein
MKRIRVLHWCLAACGVFILAGCQSSTQQGNGVALRTTNTAEFLDTYRPPDVRATNPVLGALQANRAGRVWNDGLRAARRGDTENLASSASELRRLGAASEANLLTAAAAERQVRDALNFDIQAVRASGARKQQLQQQANTRYRAALRLAPDLQSRDPQVLNALGYFLAEPWHFFRRLHFGRKIDSTRFETTGRD